MLLGRIFIVGVLVLANAIVLNAIASRLGLNTWYDFLSTNRQTSILSYIWLFVLYPLGLGLTAYLATKYIVR